MFTSTRVLITFSYFGPLVSCLINRSLFCNCLLTSIFYHSLLAYGFTHSHSTAHAGKAAWLEWRKASTSHIIWAHHHTTAESTTSKSSSEKVIVIVKAHLAKVCKRISSSLLFLLLAHIHLIIHLHASSEAHLSKWTEWLVKKVIIIIEERSEWILSSKEILEYIIGVSHVEIMEISALEMMSTTTSARFHSSVFYIFSAVCVIILSFLRIT